MPYSTSVPMMRRAVTGGPAGASGESYHKSCGEPNACSAGQRGAALRRRHDGRVGVPDPDPAAEPVAVYDAAGAVVGVATRGEVYARSLWHGVGGVLLRSGDGACVYVHRRSATKLVMPGLHDCWAGGVVGPGEDPAGTAARELAEELGVTGVPLTRLFTLVYDEGAGGLRSHLFAFEAPVRRAGAPPARGGGRRVVDAGPGAARPAGGPGVAVRAGRPDARRAVVRRAGRRGSVSPTSTGWRAAPRGRRRRSARRVRRTGARPGRR